MKPLEQSRVFLCDIVSFSNEKGPCDAWAFGGGPFGPNFELLY